MQRFFIIIAGFLIALSSAGAETIGSSQNNLAEQSQNPPLQLAQGLLPCSKNDACYERITPPWTERWCHKGSGKFDVFMLFGNNPVNKVPKSCSDNPPGDCAQYCVSK